jgi:DnaJ-domain-containing protein 1
MTFNKDIIIRLLLAVSFVAICLRIVGPIFIASLKKKLPGYNHETDIDQMIRRQKERLRSQYGLTGDVQTSQWGQRPQGSEENITPPTPEIKKIYEETKWGGGAFLKDIQQEISKNYGYTMADTKVNAFILLCEKRNYLRFLSDDHRNSPVAIKNFLVTLLLFLLLVDEVREKNFFILEKISAKLHIPSMEFALALQIKILMTISQKKELKEERIFAETLVINQYSEDTIKEAAELIAKKEANLWAKSSSQLLEELTLALNFANMIVPMPKLKNRKDLETAFEILGLKKESTTEEIKKLYKKLALLKHPDKIVSQKLPKTLERKAFERFNKIQEAYEVIMENRK